MLAPKIEIRFCEIGHHINYLLHWEAAGVSQFVQSLHHEVAELPRSRTQLDYIQGLVNIEGQSSTWHHAVPQKPQQNLLNVSASGQHLKDKKN